MKRILFRNMDADPDHWVSFMEQVCPPLYGLDELVFQKGRAQCPVTSLLSLPSYFVKMNFHPLQKCILCGLFCPDSMAL